SVVEYEGVAGRKRRIGPLTVPRSAQEPVPLVFSERYYGKAADLDERRILEQLFRLDLGEALGILESLLGLHFDDGNLGIRGVHAQHRACADGGTFVAGVIENPLCARL